MPAIIVAGISLVFFAAENWHSELMYPGPAQPCGRAYSSLGEGLDPEEQPPSGGEAHLALRDLLSLMSSN